MLSQGRSLFFFLSLIGLGLLICFHKTGALRTRCLFTHKDPHCHASGKLPMLLKCRLPGKWFTIEDISKLNSEGGWDNVNAAKSVAVAQCKRSRTASSNGGAQCEVTGTLPEIQEADVVKVDYFCWEIDPDLLGGFEKRDTI
ncbi:hypothetical protein ABFA07_016549 [Porites harrisoni]